MSKKYIAVAGNMGVGKSTLTARLSKHFGWKPYFETVRDNPYLKDFYQDMSRYAFHLQLFILTRRFKAYKEIAQAKESIIQDRTIYEDAEVFAKNLWNQGKFQQRDYESYLDLYYAMLDYIQKPDLLVYLRASVKVLKQRIKKRGRSYEQNIPDSYLEQLSGHYEDWIKRYNHGLVIVVETDHLNIVKSDVDFRSVTKMIFNKFVQKELPLAKSPTSTISI